MAPTITVAQRRARLARRHRLLPAERTDDVAVIAEDLLGLHSSDPVTVYLSALARMRNPSLAAVDAALYADRSVLRHHAMRRTLWVATPATMRRMHATTTARYAATEHRRVVGMLEGNGIADGEEWLVAAKRDVLDLLHAAGPMTARELGLQIPALAHPLRLSIGKPYEGVQAAHSRVLLQLGFEGSLVRTRPVGSWISSQYTWAAMDSWLPAGVHGPDGAALPEREAAGDLARHWLHRFGPAASADLQWWMGWTATMTRRALADAEAVSVDLGGMPGWVAPDDVQPASTAGAGEPGESGEPWVAVLPGLDPTTMGWKERSWYLSPAAADAFDRNGNAGPTVWVDGEVVAGWVQGRDGAIRLCWFADVPAPRRAQVLARAEEVRDWLGEVRFSVRFPAPYATGLQA